MKYSNDGIERRRFLQMFAAAGMAPIHSAMGKGSTGLDSAQQPTLNNGMVPRRVLGKTGVSVPCMALGCTMKKPAEMQRCLEFGVNHFDTAASYAGAEAGIGDFLKNNKVPRDKVFISTKPADINTPTPIISEIEKSLDKSLKDLGTDYIDLFCGIHACPNSDRITDELRAFAEENKKKGKFRFFGFSNHANMVANLTKAATLPWIDAVLVQYNYRLANNPKLSEAIDACVKANIGLIAIKTQGFGAKNMTDVEALITKVFTDKGYDLPQAKIKFVLEDKRFTSCAVGMKGVAQVDSCVAASLNKISLGAAAKEALQEYAEATCSNYCAGCPNICGAALPAELPMMSDVMRFLMYSENYDEHDHAYRLFHQLSPSAKNGMLGADYRLAEALCPQRIPIAGMVEEAFHRFA